MTATDSDDRRHSVDVLSSPIKLLPPADPQHIRSIVAADVPSVTSDLETVQPDTEYTEEQWSYLISLAKTTCHMYRWCIKSGTYIYILSKYFNYSCVCVDPEVGSTEEKELAFIAVLQFC